MITETKALVIQEKDEILGEVNREVWIIPADTDIDKLYKEWNMVKHHTTVVQFMESRGYQLTGFEELQLWR